MPLVRTFRPLLRSFAGEPAFPLLATLLPTVGVRQAVHPLDPAIVVAVPVILVAAALAASIGPALGALRLDPATALRQE